MLHSDEREWIFTMREKDCLLKRCFIAIEMPRRRKRIKYIDDVSILANRFAHVFKGYSKKKSLNYGLDEKNMS